MTTTPTRQNQSTISNCERESKSSKSTRIMHFLTVNKNKVSSSRSLSWSYAHSKGTQKERKMPKDMDIQIEVGRNQCASTKIYSAYNLIKQIEESHKAKIAEENQTHWGPTQKKKKKNCMKAQRKLPHNILAGEFHREIKVGWSLKLKWKLALDRLCPSARRSAPSNQD